MNIGAYAPRAPNEQRYPNEPGFKVAGSTSEAAADSMKPKAAGLRGRVLAVLHHADMTADECAQVLNKSVLSIRPRLTELKEAGQIEDTGIRRENLSGRNAIVWRLAA